MTAATTDGSPRPAPEPEAAPGDAPWILDLLDKLIDEAVRREGAGFDRLTALRALARDPATGAGGLTGPVRALAPAELRVVAAAFALHLDLLNAAEQAHLLVATRERARRLEAETESLAATVAELRARGVGDQAMAALLGRLGVEIVLTAHPTETRRRSLLTRLRRVGALLEAAEGGDLLPGEGMRLLEDLEAEIAGLWLTDRRVAARPSVLQEARGVLQVIGDSLWGAVLEVHEELVRALHEHYPGLEPPRRWLTLASWVGGDRDGNPNVTPEVTAEALRLHRRAALEAHAATLEEVAPRLSFSSARLAPAPDLTRWLDARRPLPPEVAALEARYPDEPHRIAAHLAAADLRAAVAALPDGDARLGEPIEAVAGSVLRHLPERSLRRALLAWDAFGNSAARLDVREESGRLRRDLDTILRALGLEAGFAERAPEERSGLLARLLEGEAPAPARVDEVLAAEAAPAGEEARQTWQLVRLVAGAAAGGRLTGPFIISMTRSAADVLGVALLLKWAGGAGVPVAPLFETVDDLRGAGAALEQLLDLPAYRRHLEAAGGEQMVMLGYSDSNKDSGPLAAAWALYEAQERLAGVGRRTGVPVRFFHGRGGSIARGGGAPARVMRSHPPATIEGRFRATEQGEAIGWRYGSPALAVRSLQEVVSAVLLASAPGPRAEPDLQSREVLDQVAVAARERYREVVYRTPGFLEFWRAATPLDEIGALGIGSRPTVRRQGPVDVGAVRAIPWVFSWMQSRYNLPGWLGLAAGLAAAPERELRRLDRSWPLFTHLLDNAEWSLAIADADIGERYATLVPDRALAEGICARLRRELEESRARLLAVREQRALLERQPAWQASLRLRAGSLLPLHEVQIEALRALRALAEEDRAGAAALREVVATTVNGIAAGLKSSG